MIFQTSNIKRRGGFTLIEIMISLAIFSIGILGVAAMQIRAIQGNTSGQRLTEASALAQETIERIAEEPYASFTALATGVATAIPAPPPYTISQTIAVPPVGINALWVTVTVSWIEPSGRRRDMPLTLIKSQNMETSYEPQ